ncbi:GTPase [Actinoplanes philippinensis]|uniref:GTPase n=1 Tax=Actinoplanes philippinensis TaxID=35752 RepID=UPI003407F0B6
MELTDGEFDPEDVFVREVRRILGGAAHLNLIMAGKLGTGKSTLLNGIFGEDLAETGVGASVTTIIKRHTRPGSPIAVYDTPGIELGRDHQQVIADYIAEIRKNAGDPGRRIHFALYCVRSTDRRFEAYEKEVIEQLAEEVPVFVVFTQCLAADDEDTLALAEFVNGLGMNIRDGRVFLTLAKSRTIGGVTFEGFGLPELVTAIYRSLPEAAAQTLARHQRVSLAVKVAEAESQVRVAAAAAAAIATVPIPVLDAIPLSALQFTMLARITTVMGLKVNIKAMVLAMAGIMGVAAVARQVARQFLKLFPGIGSVINAGMAAEITNKMGRVYVEACTRVCQRQIDGEDITADDATDAIIEEFRRLWTN